MLAKRDEVFRVAATRGIEIVRIELLECKFSDRLQHAEPRLAGAAFDRSHHAAIDKGSQALQHIPVKILRWGDHSLSRFQGATTSEYGKALQCVLLLRIEKLVTPRNGVSQRALPRREITRTVGQQREPSIQPREDGAWRQQTHARGGELDGQREPVQSPTDLSDDLRVGVIEHKVRLCCSGSLAKQGDGWVIRH